MRRIFILSALLIILTAFNLINTKGKGVSAAISPDVATIWTKVCSDDNLPSLVYTITRVFVGTGNDIDTEVVCYQMDTNYHYVEKWRNICLPDNGFIVETPGINPLGSGKITVRCKIP